jgi:ATP-binding cassette, subfamily C, bacterial LapB
MSEEMLAEGPRQRFAPWLLDPMRRNRGTYMKVILAAIFINVFGLLTALFSMVIYDRVVPNDAFSSLVALSIGFAIVVIFDFILKLLRAYFVDFAGAQIDRDVGDEVFSRLLAMRLDLRKGSTGSLVGIMRELEALREFFASATLTAVVDVPFIVLTLLVVALIGGWIVLVPGAMVPLVILIGWATHPALERLASRSMSEGLSKQSVLVETVGGIETVKAAGAGPLLRRRWLRAVQQQSDSAMRQRLVSSLGVTFAGTAGTVSYAGVVIVGVVLISAHQLTMGGLIACSLLSGRAITPLAQISQLLSRLTATRSAYRQVKALMALPIEGPAGQPLQVGALEGRIEFKNVTFGYPGAAEPVLRNLSFGIDAGQHVALLGRIGSGKSTIARLILGLYPPAEGLVLIDGTDIRQLDLPALRSRIGVALQESVLLTGTVRENIVLGREHVDDEEMIRSATLSATHQFMSQLANGYELRLADRGEGLSGGQRQSIAIARALAGRPSVMIMDEPTSAMDAQTEAGLIKRLKEEMAGRTMIVITHRPALLALVDRIIVMENGQIAADGPRDAVLKKLSGQRAAA